MWQGWRRRKGCDGMANRLKEQASPYLRMHQDNPVDWYPWCAEAFQRAKEEQKLLFLSIGYSACHWCHVIARESFSDEEVADFLRAHFISVKVDREERPDIDAVYLLACQVFAGSGGWPTTILATPDGKPIFAATYLPKEQLLSVLFAAWRKWESNPEQVQAAADAVSDHINGFARPRQVELQAVKPLLDEMAEQYRSHYDFQYGGFGTAPKFPTPHAILFLLRYGARQNDSAAWHMAVHTLEQMARGGIYDQLGGGFCRYSTDQKWLVPHFEKMLYDNALLLWLYAEGWRLTGNRWLRGVAEATADYLLRELRLPGGGFASSQDADSDGIEGGFYLFTPEEVCAALGEVDGQKLCQWYDITEAGNWEGKSIPNLLQNAQYQQEPEWLDGLRQRLRVWREKRYTLRRDDKVIASWNAMAIGALAAAGRLLKRPDYLTAAEEAAASWKDTLMDPHGKLVHSGYGLRMGYDGLLEDYAYGAWAWLELFRATDEQAYLVQAKGLAEAMEEQFAVPEGGFALYGQDSEPLIARPVELYDGAVPSGNAMAALVLLRLSRETGEDVWKARAESQLTFLRRAVPMAQATGYSFSGYVLLEAEEKGVEMQAVFTKDS